MTWNQFLEKILNFTVSSAVLENLEIEVSSSDTISVWAEQAGTDTGTGRVSCTLVFAK
jgi:hypothetical protein